MFTHMGIVFRDLKASGTFYHAVLAQIGVRQLEDHTQPEGTGWLVFGTDAPEAPFFVVSAGRPSFWVAGSAAAKSPVHIASARRRAKPWIDSTPRDFDAVRQTMAPPKSAGAAGTTRSSSISTATISKPAFANELRRSERASREIVEF
jgi:catechol 2,3-dioxygenase-like lactoylglutathione lyase family enzyme